MQAFHFFAAIYLAIALWAAWRVPGLTRRPGARAQLRVLVAVLGAGLLWPDRARAAVADAWHD